MRSLHNELSYGWLSCLYFKGLLINEQKEAKKAKNGIEEVQERLKQHAEAIQTGNDCI